MKSHRIKIFLFIALAATNAAIHAEPPVQTTLDLIADRERWTIPEEARVGFSIDQGITIESEKPVWVMHDGVFDDFDLSVEVKVPAGVNANSGIAFRAAVADDSATSIASKPQAYQCEIDDSDRAWSGGLHIIGQGWVEPDKQSEISIARFLQRSRGSFRSGNWNRFRIIAQGNRIRIYVNDILTVDRTDDSFVRGSIGIQNHGGHGIVQFRKIQLRALEKSITDE